MCFSRHVIGYRFKQELIQLHLEEGAAHSTAVYLFCLSAACQSPTHANTLHTDTRVPAKNHFIGVNVLKVHGKMSLIHFCSHLVCGLCKPRIKTNPINGKILQRMHHTCNEIQSTTNGITAKLKKQYMVC